MLQDIVRMALRNLIRSRLRSLLTMLGIFIGIAAVVSLVSLSQGLKTSIAAEFENLGADKIFISPENSNFGAFSDVATNPITRDDLERVLRTRGVRRGAGFIQTGITVESGDEEGVFYLTSFAEDTDERELMIQASDLEIERGKLLTRGDSSHVIIGAELTREGLFSKQLDVGAKIRIKGEVFEVAGVWKKMGDPGVDTAVWMGEDRARELLDEPDTYSVLMVQSSAGDDPLVVAESVRRSLRNFRGLDKDNEDFDVQTPDDILEAFNSVLTIIQIVLVGVAAISLFVGGVGIMNTMYTAVLERTNEIGVLKAIGARNEDILSLFVVEAGFLGMAGGIIGVGLGIGIAEVVKFGAQLALGTDLIQVFFPWYLILGALAFAFVIGALSGFLPAYQASQLQPVEALRYE